MVTNSKMTQNPDQEDRSPHFYFFKNARFHMVHTRLLAWTMWNIIIVTLCVLGFVCLLQSTFCYPVTSSAHMKLKKKLVRNWEA